MNNKSGKIAAMILGLFALLIITGANAETDPIKVFLELYPNQITEVQQIEVSIRVTNTGESAMPGPVKLYNPSGRQIREFGEPVLEAGTSQTWAGVWMVTQAQIDERKITFSIAYPLIDEGGRIVEKTLHFSKMIARKKGIFPTADQLFGVTMPDMRFAIGRNADRMEKAEVGEAYFFNHFTVSDYNAFDYYAARSMLKVLDQRVDDGTLIVELAKDGASIFLCYDYAQQQASLTYGSGTRLEREARPASSTTRSIMPSIQKSFGMPIPALNAVLPLHPAAQVLQENSKNDSIRYTEVSMQDYDKINSYLTALGCSCKDWHTGDGMLYATIAYGTGVFSLRYDLEEQCLIIICPELYYWDSIGQLSSEKNTELILPTLTNALGTILPRISTAILRYPTTARETQDGYKEIYEEFSEKDYESFSTYLLKRGCIVTGYEVDNKGVLQIELSMGDVSFTFSYDQAEQRAESMYPQGALLEPEFAASAAATPKPTNTPAPVTQPPYTTPRPTTKTQQTGELCWNCHSRTATRVVYGLPVCSSCYSEVKAFFDYANGR